MSRKRTGERGGEKERGERQREREEKRREKELGGVKTNDVDPSLFFLYALIPVGVIREHCDLLSAKRKSASERIHCGRGH